MRVDSTQHIIEVLQGKLSTLKSGDSWWLRALPLRAEICVDCYLLHQALFVFYMSLHMMLTTHDERRVQRATGVKYRP